MVGLFQLIVVEPLLTWCPSKGITEYIQQPWNLPRLGNLSPAISLNIPSPVHLSTQSFNNHQFQTLEFKFIRAQVPATTMSATTADVKGAQSNFPSYPGYTFTLATGGWHFCHVRSVYARHHIGHCQIQLGDFIQVPINIASLQMDFLPISHQACRLRRN